MSLLPIEKGRRERSVTQTNLWLRHLADTIATSEPSITETELSSRWRELPWPRRQEIWRSWTKPSGAPDEVVYGTWWDWSTFGWGLYYRQDDEDISTVVTSTEQTEKWLTADGVGVHTKESSFVTSCSVM